MNDIPFWYATGKSHWEPTVLTEQEYGETKEETVDQTKEWPTAKGKTLAPYVLFLMSSFAFYVLTTQMEMKYLFEFIYFPCIKPHPRVQHYLTTTEV